MNHLRGFPRSSALIPFGPRRMVLPIPSEMGETRVESDHRESRAVFTTTLAQFLAGLIGLGWIGSLLYLVLGVALTLMVEHFGWLPSWRPFSAVVLSSLDTAAYIFAWCAFAMAAAMWESGVVAVALVVALIAGILSLVGYSLPFLWEISSRWVTGNLDTIWYAAAGLVFLAMVLFAVQTAPRSFVGLSLAIALGAIALLAGAFAYQVWTDWASDRSPWARYWLAVGAFCAIYLLWLFPYNFLLERMKPDKRALECTETWMFAGVVTAALVITHFSWQFVVDVVAYESWLASIAAGLAIVAGVGVALVVLIGATVGVARFDSESDTASETNREDGSSHSEEP